MHRAIEQLKVTPEHLLIDGNRFKPYPKIGHSCIIKGDGKYLSIAAASVLAKTYRDDYMLQHILNMDGTKRKDIQPKLIAMPSKSMVLLHITA